MVIEQRGKDNETKTGVYRDPIAVIISEKENALGRKLNATEIEDLYMAGGKKWDI